MVRAEVSGTRMTQHAGHLALIRHFTIAPVHGSARLFCVVSH